MAVLATRLADAQGTAFTYQGRLTQNGGLATGIYDMRFTLHDTLAGVSQVAGPLVNPTVGVSNGLFTVTLDFGNGAFNGNPRWLQIGVRTNGSAATHTPLSPRQPVTAAPYAVLAGSVTGNISDSQLSANIARLNGNQTFTGTATFNPASGAPFGVGANANKVSNLNVDLLDGLDSTAFWKLGGNAGSSPVTHFLGASDNAQVRLHATGGFLVDDATPGLSFGATRRQMISLWNAQFGLGIQDFTLYQRSGNQFAWFLNGSHTNTAGDAGPGGSQQMLLSANGDLYVRQSIVVDNAALSDGDSRPGLIFGPGSGEAIASVRGTNGANRWGLDFYTGFQKRLSIANNGGIGIGTTTPVDALLDVEGPLRMNDQNIYLRAADDRNHGLGHRGTVAGHGIDGPFLFGFNGGALGVAGPDSVTLVWDWVGNVWISNQLNTASLNVRGEATVKVLNITGGADIAEPFQITHAKEIPKGAVVVIDEENPGHLKMSDGAYDTRVAGIVSGANGINPGLALQQQGVIEGGQNVALTGRVYALADASSAPIKPGDLLTTSDTPGHVMKVSDRARGSGAILGKAMTSLKDGKGMVLVLVSLQ